MRGMRRFLLAAALLAAPPLLPAAADEALLRAEAAFRADKPALFAARAKKVAAQYAPLVEYRRAVLDLRRNRPQTAAAFVDGVNAAAASPYLRARALALLLEFYAGKKDWKSFAARAAQTGDDEDGDCARALANLRANAAAARARLMDLWQKDTRMNSPLCLRLYRHAKKAGALSKDAVWIKLRDLAGNRRLAPTRRLLNNFRGFVRYSTVRRVARRPTPYIRGKHGLRTRANRELVIIAAMATARRRPALAIERWEKFSRYYSNEDNQYVWTALAVWAARWHRDDALLLFARGGAANDDALSWKTRAALRADNAKEAINAIDAMSEESRQISAWRYWRAAMQKQQGDANGGDAALRQLAQDEDDYYGLLAREETGLPVVGLSATAQAQEPQAAAQADGDFALALLLYDAGLAKLAGKMWRRALKDEAATPARLLAAARASAARKWFLASVNAANKSKLASAHNLRFPLPYNKDIMRNSAARRLDAAFVYGIIRQESRFMPNAVSAANARGLMQVIPRTARLVARRHGYGKYRLSRLKRVDTNVVIGTTYLSDLARRLDDDPAKVAAAYNAGPSRVRRWYRASANLAVAIENIPTTETRLYVKHILANRMHYAARLGKPESSMRRIMGKPIRVGG